MITLTHTTRPFGKVTYLTEKGLVKLQAELDDLRNVRREKIAQRLRDASDNEELSENVEFMLAKYEQSWVEGRISELEKILTRVEIIKPGNSTINAPNPIKGSGLPTSMLPADDRKNLKND